MVKKNGYYIWWCWKADQSMAIFKSHWNLLWKSGDHEVLVVNHPRDPGAFLWHNLSPLDDWIAVAGFFGLENPDFSIATNGGDETSASAPLGAEQLIAVTLELKIVDLSSPIYLKSHLNSYNNVLW